MAKYRWLPWSVIRLSHENTDHCQQRELMFWCEDCTPQYYVEDGGDGIDDLMCIWQPWGQDKALLSLKPSVSDHSWPQHAVRWQPPHPPDMRPPQLEILLEPSVFVSLAALSWTSTLLRCLSHFWLSVIARCFQKYLGVNQIYSICFILTLLWAVWSIDPVLCGMEIVVIMSPIKTQNSTQSNRNYLLLWKERKFVEHFFAIISCLFLLLNQTCLSSKMVQISKSSHPDRLRQFLLLVGRGVGVWWLIHCQLVCIFKASILTQKPTHWPVAGLIPSTRNVVTLQYVPWVWLRGVDCFDEAIFSRGYWDQILTHNALMTLTWPAYIGRRLRASGKKHPQKRTQYEGEEKSWVEV